jgi:acetolactate synthase-1/2/3 large subunit
MTAKLLYSDRKVVAVCGDGGFMMNSQELETAVRLGLDLVVIILNDSGYGMIKWKQQAMNMGDYGLDFGNPDFVKYAESYGAHGYRIDDTNNLGSVIHHALESKGIHIIDVPVDYSENIKVMTNEMTGTCEL